MPIIKSAIKRMKQTAIRRTRNQKTKQDMKSAVKAFLATPSAQTLSTAQSEIDTAVKKNVLNPATAARRKSTLVKVAKAANVKLEKTAKKAAPKTAAKTSAKPAVKKAAPKTAVAKKPAVKKAAPKKPSAKK